MSNKTSGKANAEKADKAVKAVFSQSTLIADISDFARELYDKGRFGEPFGKSKFSYSLVEGLYLLEKEKMVVEDGRGRKLDFNAFVKKARRVQSDFWTKYVVFRDMRNRGYIVKTALKFGADFRVYDRGIKPGEDHAKWVLYPVHESKWLTWHDFSAKNRVAHSTRKKLLIGVVDDEGDVTYYQISWVRP